MVGRFVRSHGGLCSLLVLIFFVSFTNLSARAQEDRLVGYYEKEENKQKIITAAEKQKEEESLTDTIDDDAMMQLAIGTDVENRKKSAEQSGAIRGNEDDLVTDSADLIQPGLTFVDGELTNEVEIYAVQPGDTAVSIARDKSISVETLLWANDLAKASDIEEGDSLFILPITGVKHKVANADTLSSIAKEYKADEQAIIAFNSLPANGELRVGDEIIVPEGKIAPKPQPRTVASNSFIPRRTYTTSGETRGRFAHPFPGSIRTQGLHPTNAVDLAKPSGSPVYAADSGRVTKVFAGGWGGGYGNHVVVTHDDGVITLYAHLSRSLVSKGDKVNKGEEIALSGNTGRSTGPHLHFEVRGAGNPF